MKYEGIYRINEVLPLFEVNKSVHPNDIPRLSKQASAIFGLLKRGDVSTGMMSSIACQYNSRLWEIRQALAFEGKTVRLVRKGDDGNNWYRIENL